MGIHAQSLKRQLPSRVEQAFRPVDFLRAVSHGGVEQAFMPAIL